MLRPRETGVRIHGLARSPAIAGVAAILLGLLASSGASAQCSGPLTGTLDRLVPVGRGGSISSLISVIDTANTSFLAGTSAFVGSPKSNAPNQQVGGVWTRALVGTVENENTSVATGGTLALPPNP